MWRIDPKSGERAELKVGGAPRAVVFDGADLWITDSSRAAVSKVVRATGVRTDYATPTPATALFHDRSRLYVTATSTLSVFDVATGVRADHQLESLLGDIAVIANDVWVTLPIADAIVKMTL
jgi:hypothetical protein